MGETKSELSVNHVYDIASEIGNEVEKMIGSYGVDAASGIVPKLVNTLEKLELLATKNEHSSSHIQELEARVLKLEKEKIQRAEDRLRHEKEMEIRIAEWKKEAQDLKKKKKIIKKNNRSLKNALAAEQDISVQHMAPEMDISEVQRLREMVDQLRNKVRKTEHDASLKTSHIDDLSDQVEKLVKSNDEISRKTKVTHSQIQELVDDKVDMCGIIHDLNIEIASLRQEVGDNHDLQHVVKGSGPATEEKDDANIPLISGDQLKQTLHEIITLKAKISDLEEEVATVRPKQDPASTSSKPTGTVQLMEHQEVKTSRAPLAKKFFKKRSNSLLLMDRSTEETKPKGVKPAEAAL